MLRFSFGAFVNRKNFNIHQKNRMNNEHLLKFSDLFTEPKKRSKVQVSTTTGKKIRKVFGGSDPEQVERVYLDKSDKIVYVDAETSPVSIILPTKFDPSREIIVKRMYTSNYTVYVEAQDGQSIEGEQVIGLLSNDEGSSFIVLRFLDDTWHIFG